VRDAAAEDSPVETVEAERPRKWTISFKDLCCEGVGNLPHLACASGSLKPGKITAVMG
jgi:hypothetical protein